MNNDVHVLDELSALLDGEAEDPGHIESHLRACPACAQRYRELRAVTTQVRRLNAPEVRPEFVKLVVARVREAQAAPAPAPWRAWLQALRMPQVLIPAGALCGVLLGFGLYEIAGPSAPSAPREQRAEATAPASQSPLPAEESVVSALADNGVDVLQLAEVFGVDESMDDSALAEPAEDIESEFSATLDAGWETSGDDSFGDIETLSQEQQAAVKQLLQSGGSLDAVSEG